MLLVVEKRIRGGIKQMYCHTIHRYAKSNNKYMKKKTWNHHISNI